MRVAHEDHPAARLLGNSPAIHRVYEQISRAAKTEVPVLITGESGTGKEVTARLLHDLGARRSHTFLRVNCPAIPSQLFESELFGHEAGAFTGAKGVRSGRFEQADKGTLFLDEIGELDLNLQSKLLHALQDFRIARLGGTEERVVDLRLICATNRELEEEVANGTFRADLFYRVNVLRIEMPPLRERPTDVPILMNHFIKMYSELFGCDAAPLSPAFMKLLELYHWPGNVREMQNMAKRYVVLGTEEHVLSALRERDNAGRVAHGQVDLTTPLRVQTKRAVLNLEKQIILNVLEANKWNRTKTARSLNISYRALLYKIKEAGLPPIRMGKMDSAEVDCGEHAPQLDEIQEI
jgi:two-component system, NtrC family, response regulator AtoC